MADDGETDKTTENYPREETFKRTQETQSEHKFPSGIISIPLGCRGPKSLYLKRIAGSFGFTLRHFIIYPPDGLTEEDDPRLAALGALNKPMETIFVRKVKCPGPAHTSGLQKGDRIVAVNGIQVIDKPYSFVIQLIQKSPAYLHLLVVPKEEDALQRLFTDTAYNPVSNKSFILDSPPLDARRNTAQQFKNFQHQPEEFRVDAQFWRTLRYPFDSGAVAKPTEKRPHSFQLDYRKSANHSCGPNEIYTEIQVHNSTPVVPSQSRYQKSGNKAQPQVPLYKKMGRRASEGNAKQQQQSFNEYSSSIVSDDEFLNQKSLISESNSNMSILTYPSSAGCRLSLNENNSNNESSSSLNSYNLNGGGSSLSSNLTLTGHETTEDDDSAILSRYRKSFQQKEEFLRTPPMRSVTERNGTNARWPPQNVSKQLNEVCEEKRPIQLVQTRAKQFESGRSLPEDDPLLSDRTSFYKSELAKISSKRLVPNVSERAQEYETKTSTPKRIQRDCKSFESPDSSVNDLPSFANRLSGNVLIPTGSKYVHCPPPSDNNLQNHCSGKENHRTTQQHFRSNSAEIDERIFRKPDENEEEKIIETIPAPSALIPESVKRFPASQTIGIDDDTPPVVRRRIKNTLQTASLGEDDRITRRESYLKATEGSRLHFEYDLNEETSPQALRSAHRRWRPPLFPGDIQQLRKLFEDAASSFGGSVSGNSSSSTSLEKDKSLENQFDHHHHLIREGTLNCKITELDGKRPVVRSWRQVHAVLRGSKLYLFKDKSSSHHLQVVSPIGTSELLEQSLSNGIDIRTSLVRVAEDYTKKKHVLKVSTLNPCRSELLLQAESSEDLSEWMQVLNEQGANTTHNEIEAKSIDLNSKLAAFQQSSEVPKTLENNRLLPQPLSIVTGRNRSPSSGGGGSGNSGAQSPVKSAASTSPKSKTWRGRVAKQFRKIQGGASSPNSPTSTTPPDGGGSTFGVPLEQCISSSQNRFVPKFVEICTNIVDERGLQTVGIYRVPGNNASITGLTDEINRNYEDVPTDDVRWNDVHVVSSLLKSFFRKLPDSLVTNTFYLSFIRADKIEDRKERLKELKRLIKNLPPHNYHTLKHLILHLNRVMENSEINKMDAKNVAIVFGPNIVRPEEETMADMVSNNSHQCKILVTLLNHANWFFSDTDDDDVDLDSVTIQDVYEDHESASNQQALLDSISKLESLPHKEKNGALFSSIISAAQRKVKRKTKGVHSLPENNKNEMLPSTPTNLTFSSDKDDKTSNPIPTTVRDIENKQPNNNNNNNRVPWFNYATDQEEFQKRIEKFKNETEAMLMRPRYLEINVDKAASRNSTSLTASASKQHYSQITKTNSVSDVFNRTKITSVGAVKGAIEDGRDGIDAAPKVSLKKYDFHRSSSLDSINKDGIDEDTDLVSAMTKIYDKKLEDYTQPNNNNILNGEDFPYVDESPERIRNDSFSSISNKENTRPTVPPMKDLYKNPSLHKQKLRNNDNSKKENCKIEIEKDVDSSAEAPSNHPDNGCQLNFKFTLRTSKLKRSESLNKPDRSSSKENQNNIKVRRSESLNKTSYDKFLKRSDSNNLTKMEKTESNINKKRELLLTRRTTKELKRKNGTPDRSIKRRHTVGGTKDPDKITLLGKYHQNENDNENCKDEKEKVHRTSSPDLSVTRRERFLFEINLIGPENMVVALRQHLIGGRPQSFPESRVFKMPPLESHV